MTTIIISDIHNRTKWIEPGLQKLKELFNYDEVVFLGDYFDNFGDTAFEAGGTANWLKQSTEHPDRIHLLGNHDMPYRFPFNDFLWCPGFSAPKAKVVTEAMKDHWKHLRPAYFTQGWLLSHAGFSSMLYGGYPTPEELIEEANKDFETVKKGLPAAAFQPGYRMGGNVTGGITWCDWGNEFDPLTNVFQIVGHTPSNKIQKFDAINSENYCMDTHNQHIGVIIDGEVTFHLRSQLLGF